MTKDDIIRMAQKAKFLIDTHAQQYQPNCILSTYGLIDENLERFANLVAAAEREACAKVCDDYDVAEDVNSCDTAEGIALAIRARGNT
jgi:hypothetical protein